MAKKPKISNAAAIAAIDAITALLDVSAPGHLKIFSVGAGIPDYVDDGADSTAVQLAKLPLSTTSFGAGSDGTPGGVCEAAAITNDTSAVAGTASFFMAEDGASTDIVMGNCGTTSDFDMTMNTTSISSGATVSVTSWLITMPEGTV